MDRPDAASVRAMSKVDFGTLGYEEDADLQVVVDQANAYIEFVTGQTLDANMPTEFEKLAGQAVRMRTEQVAFQAQEDYVETVNDDAVSSFSAGSYSETRRDNNAKRNVLNLWPGLNDLLWMMMTADKYDYWMGLLTGVNAPAFSITEVAWTRHYAGMSDDTPWLVEPRSARFATDEIIDLNAWSW
jgi:hypothetical protein